MTTEQAAGPAEDEQEFPELEVPFRGRKMWVRMPTPEQLLVWQRVMTRLTDSPIDTSWTGSEVMAALERLRKIIDSILVNKTDVVWIDDQFLEGTLRFKDLVPYLTEVVDAFASAAAENGNREQRRAAAKKAPAKKAARKKVTPIR